MQLTNPHSVFLFLVCSSLHVLGCGSSLVIPDEEQTVFSDGGIDGLELIDASDNRNIPVNCYYPADCDDGDPCTVDICNAGFCEFSTKTIALDPHPLSLAGAAVGIALAPNAVYVAEGEGGVEAFDISAPATPRFLGNIATAGDAIAVDADIRGLVVAEGAAGFETFASGTLNRQTEVVPGDARLGGLEEVIEIGLGPVYSIASGYADGISALNLTSLGNASSGTYLDTTGRAVAAASASDSCGLVADSLGGAVAVNYRTEEGIVLGGRVITSGRVVDVAVAGDTALVAEYGAGFSIVDLSDPSSPTRLALVPCPSPVVSVALLGMQTGVVAEESGRVALYDLRNPFEPAILATWKASAEIVEVDADDGLLAFALGTAGAVVIQTGCSAL